MRIVPRMPCRRKGAVPVSLCLLLMVVCPAAAPGDVSLPRIFGDNMVLQREQPLPIWGLAEAGDKVTVKIGGQTKSATADKNGTWSVTLPPMKATGKPLEVVVQGKNTITLKNVLIGEVWLGSGQSNMAMAVGGCANKQKEIADAKYPNIRMFTVGHQPSLRPRTDVKGKWVVCSPKTVGGFSGAAYFFGREIHKELKVPVGLVVSSWGGTLIEPWLSPESLAGEPKLKDLADRVKKPGRINQRTFFQFPAALFQGMIRPLVPLAIRGVIWYQGESNVLLQTGRQYFVKKKTLISGWRKAWGQGDFAFLYVQIAPWRRYRPGRLPFLWEAQTQCLTIPNTGMAVTTDITGNLGNIHPPNKQDVGKRLALWALAKTYGRKGIVYSGPLYKSMAVKDGKVTLTFDHVGGGLKSRDGKAPSWFTIAGADKKFVPAEAKIEGDNVVVSSKDVAKPVAVRFGWSRLAVPNLCNKEGLPAPSFRTDRW